MSGRRKTHRLGVDTAVARYEAERQQGELIAAGHESAWGWTSPTGRLRASERASFLIREAHLRPGIRCLELGAGTGEFSARLVSSGCELTAVELSERTAKVCEARVDGTCEVLLGNIETGEGLEGRTFDAIVGVSVLHHVNLDAVLDQMLTRLRPQGRFAFSEPNLANPQVWLERNMRVLGRIRHVTPHETAFLAGGLRARFEDAGFLVDVCQQFDFLHPALPRIVLPLAVPLAHAVEKTPLRLIAGSIRIAGSRP